jgi:ABC-2 type transport system ATP-binding protein
MIRIENLTKKYHESENIAVNNISLQINKAEVFGLLGPNGAGKTTIFSMLCGLFPPTSGKIFFDNQLQSKNMNKFKAITGVVPQDIALYPTLTGIENLMFFGRMYGIEEKKLKPIIEQRIEEFGLTEHANKKVKHYSGGLKRRINIIAGILHNPEILLLDEPAVGIDAHSRFEIMELLKKINKTGTTIIYTSHYLDEAEKFCSEIAILESGKIIAQGNPYKLIEQNNCKNLEQVFFKLTK